MKCLSGTLRVVLLIAALAAARSFAQEVSQDAEPSAEVSSTAALQQARAAFAAGDYERSIELFRLGLESEDTNAIALEYLGVAYQHQGQLAEAEALYQRFLREHAEHTASPRVQQRLDALLALQESERTPVVSTARAVSAWSMDAQLSQEYWMFNEQRDGLGDTYKASSLLSWVDVNVARTGDRLDAGVVVNGGYLHELEATTRTRNQANLLVSNAYLKLLDDVWQVEGRVGRQTLYTDGVLGRFDGIRVSKRLREGRYRINANLGVPVDAPGYMADTARPFASVSVDSHWFDERLQLNVFGIVAQNDGVSERQAVGGRATWQARRWRVLGAVDYDASYNTLNSALLQADVQPFNRLTAYARLHWFASPFLMTRNALIGAPVATLDELRDNFTVGQLRTLARARTSDATLHAFGASYRLSERWVAKTDVSVFERDARPDVASYAGLPREQHIITRGSLTGSSVLRGHDTLILNGELSSNTRYDLITAWADYRLPIGSRLRIAPRLALSQRQGSSSVEDAWIATPSLRVLYRPRPRFRLEFEVGGRWMQQSLDLDPFLRTLLDADDELSTELFVNLSWRMML